VLQLILLLDCTKLYNHENHSWFKYNKDVERTIEHLSRKMYYTYTVFASDHFRKENENDSITRHYCW